MEFDQLISLAKTEEEQQFEIRSMEMEENLIN